MIALSTPEIERSEDRIVSLCVRRDGTAIVMVDDPQHDDNPITSALQAQLAAAITRIEEDASIAAAVLASGKSGTFIAGLQADLLTSIKFATDGERIAWELGHLMRRLENLHKPVVAAVQGAAYGGGFELALACHAIVSSDDASAVFGLPAVHVGLVPCANGALRVARRAGLRVALDVAVEGTTLRAEKAHALGLVDDVCTRAIVIDAAIRQAKALVGHVPPGRVRPRSLATLALEANPLARQVLLRSARRRVDTRHCGTEGARRSLLDVLDCFAAKGFDDAAQLEARTFGELVVTETAHRLIEVSVATTALGRDPRSTKSVEGVPRHLQRIAVLGAGPIGCGIAYAAISSGIDVRLKERSVGALGRGLREIKGLLDARVAAHDRTRLESDQVFARLSVTADLSGLRHAHAVIEAVNEDLASKQEILREVEASIDPTCLYATSTFALPVSTIARDAVHPERVLGVHYADPAGASGLLEVVRADKTGEPAVAAAVALGNRQGKTVIVVKDGPGFYTGRILIPWMNEAMQLVSEGVSIQAIDQALIDWGFSLGPMQRMDDLGIDQLYRVAQRLHSAFGARMTPPGALAAVAADDRRGKKNRRGFYRYAADGPRKCPTVDASVYAVFDVEPRAKLPLEEIQMRCSLAMVNEAVRCLGEEIIFDPRDGDVGAIFGLGFPMFRGGPLRYVDTIGATDVLRRVNSYADRFGERWRPAPLLVQMARRGERFFR